MDTKTNNSNVKTTVFNLIIMDESGSMGPFTNATVSGCNEVINVIKSDEEKNSDKRRNLVSIYAFQSNDQNPSHYLIKNKPACQTAQLTTHDYRPWGATPLLDAIGMTLSDLEAIAATHEDATAVVTIFTDGYENSSTDYDYHHVAEIISRLKEKGWVFNFIGANIDEMAVGKKLNIDAENIVKWEASAEGMKKSMNTLSESLEVFACERNAEYNMPLEDRVAFRKSRSKSFFPKKKH